MNKKIIHLFLFLLITAICLSPRFSFGVLFIGRNIDIRAEDIILCFGLIVSFLYIIASGKYKLNVPPLFWPILSIFLFGFFSVLVNLLLGNIVLSVAFFYFLKEIEFFIFYFTIFYCLNSFELSKQIIKYWFIFSLINIIWIIYVFIFKIKWSMSNYGPNSFIEPQGPFPSGGFFLMLFIFSFNLFIFYYNRIPISRYKKIGIFVLSVSPALGVVFSGTMASVIGLFTSIVVSLLLFFKDRMNILKLVKSLILILLILILLITCIHMMPVAQREISWNKVLFEYSSGAADSRGGLFKIHLAELLDSPRELIIGTGVYLEAHSYYMRVALERGVIGLCLFVWLMWSILRCSYAGLKEKKNLFGSALSGGLFVATTAMLVMAIPNDVFMVVKPDEVYWFFAAMAMVEIIKTKKIVGITN